MRIARVLGWAVLAIAVAAVAALAIGYVRSDNDCERQLALTPRRPMTAVIRCDYGTADVLQLAQVDIPVPGDEEIQIGRAHV